MTNNRTKKAKQSRRTRTHSNRRFPGECCKATMGGLQHWYVEMFEKLGWMILAKSKGMTDKTTTYRNSLYRLKMALEQKMNSVNNTDSKNDIIIMLENVNILIRHVEKDFRQ
jgi:hypothetical protein